MDTPVDIYFNPRCSKCQGARQIVEAHGIQPNIVRYLEHPPDRGELERILRLLALDDPRAMMRTSEPLYRELNLATAGRDTLLDAMARHPVLIQRPIVIRGNRAVIARPPERLLDILEPEER